MYFYTFPKIYVTLKLYNKNNSGRKAEIFRLCKGETTNGMEDGKVVLKKIIISDTEEPETESQKDTVAPVLSEDIKMLVTSMIHKDGKAFARVSFLRDSDWAEGIVPGGRIEKAEGFSREEIKKLEDYLAGEEDMILRQAKGVNPIRNLFK